MTKIKQITTWILLVLTAFIWFCGRPLVIDKPKCGGQLVIGSGPACWCWEYQKAFEEPDRFWKTDLPIEQCKNMEEK